MSFETLSETWDAIIVGAGPAGTMTAIQLAERGRQVLLVESKRFPRDKVCGGCLNRRAWRVLQTNGLAERLVSAGALELNELHLVCGARRAEWSMPTMHAISRRTMDDVLVRAATERGVHVLMETQARIEQISGLADSIQVHLKHRPTEGSMGDRTLRAKVAISADGLTHSSLGGVEQVASQIAAGSRVGLGVTLNSSSSRFEAGRLTMVVGDCGYVGITRVEENRLNLAAAVTTSSLRSGRSPGEVVAGLLASARVEVPWGCEIAQWCGTPALTRESQQWAARRLFLVGDAAGYVEPFTGEGMSWALAGAVEVSQFADQAIDQWQDDLAGKWHTVWRKFTRQHQAACRGLAWLLRRPALAEFTLGAVRYTPWVANQIIQRVAG